MFEIYDISVSVKLPLNRKLFIPPFCGISYYERLFEKCYNEANTDYEKFIFRRYRYILDCTKDCGATNVKVSLLYSNGKRELVYRVSFNNFSDLVNFEIAIQRCIGYAI